VLLVRAGVPAKRAVRVRGAWGGCRDARRAELLGGRLWWGSSDCRGGRPTVFMRFVGLVDGVDEIYGHALCALDFNVIGTPTVSLDSGGVGERDVEMNRLFRFATGGRIKKS
jgi:hypothetical protein